MFWLTATSYRNTRCQSYKSCLLSSRIRKRNDFATLIVLSTRFSFSSYSLYAFLAHVRYSFRLHVFLSRPVCSNSCRLSFIGFPTCINMLFFFCIRVYLFYLVVIIHAVPVTVRYISCPYVHIVCVITYYIYIYIYIMYSVKCTLMRTIWVTRQQIKQSM